MPCTLNKKAWERLIDENIEWLDNQPDTLEAKHIREILEWTKTHRPDTEAKRIEKLKIENAKLNIILYHRENGLSHPDFNAELEISKQSERIEKIEAALQGMVPFIEDDFPIGTGTNHGTCASDEYQQACDAVIQAINS